MFSAAVPEAFEREYGSTPVEWHRALPGAVGGHRLALAAEGLATVHLLDGGSLTLRWQVLPERRIALARLPRLQVAFHFDGVDAAARVTFMRHFDLYTQRGGG
jgi:hypothetical protein